MPTPTSTCCEGGAMTYTPLQEGLTPALRPLHLSDLHRSSYDYTRSLFYFCVSLGAPRAVLHLARPLANDRRGADVEVRSEPNRAMAGLRCFNGSLTVVAGQLLVSQVIAGVGYPDGPVMQVLTEKAEIDGRGYGLRWSPERILQEEAPKARTPT